MAPKTNLKYLLDANVFIEAARRYYNFDIAPSFWEALKTHGNSGSVKTIDRIKDELVKGKDDLGKWVTSDFKGNLISTDRDSVIAEYQRIISWSSTQNYTDAAKAELASIADPWLVACAKSDGFIVVTHEVLNNNIQRKIPIPNICGQFNVQYMNTFEMLKSLGIKL